MSFSSVMCPKEIEEKGAATIISVEAKKRESCEQSSKRGRFGGEHAHVEVQLAPVRRHVQGGDDASGEDRPYPGADRG